MKKFFPYLLLLSLIVMFVSACSSSDEDSTPDNSNTPKYQVDFQVRTDAGARQVTVEWQMDPKAETYNIRYIEDDGTNTRPDYTEMESITPIAVKSAPYIVTGLKANTTYWFSVSGVNPQDESYLWLPAQSRTTDYPPPPAPENVRPNPGNTKVTISWKPVTAVPEVTSYKIYCYWQEGLNAGVGQAINVEGQSSNSKIVDTVYWTAGNDKGTSIAGTTTALKNGRTYFFYLSAVNATGESSPSFAIYSTPSEDPPPAAPTSLIATSSASELTSGQIYLDWTAVPGVTYNVYGGTAKGVTKNPDALIASGGGTAGYIATCGEIDTKWYFVVTAVGANGKESAESNEVSAMPKQ